VNPDRIEENGNVFDFSLNQEEMEHMNSFNCDGRVIDPPSVWENKNEATHKHYPFNIEF